MKKQTLFEKIDSKLMDGVNVGVRAWNWTTGRTKADLAKILQVAGTSSLIATGFMNGPLPGITVSLTAIPNLAISLIRYHHQTNLETESQDKNVMSFEIEQINFINKVNGYLWIGSELILPYLAANSTQIVAEGTYGVASIGYLGLGLAHHIMRADYLPPRKDCVRRGLSKLAERLSEINIPDPLPQPSPVPSNYQVI